LAKSISTRWGPERRLEFIDFRLRWDGTINRKELVDFFGISVQQASSDLARYAEKAPTNLAYDKSAKTYRATSSFKPWIARSDAQHFLAQLSGISVGTAPASGLFVGWRPPFDVVRYPTRPVKTDTLLRVLWAIRDGSEIRIVYQSLRQPKAASQWIAPHALASDGTRWHARAWSSETSDFRDFVLSRVERVTATRPSTTDPRRDENWHSCINVMIRPRAELSDEQRLSIEIDYGMKQGRLVLNCRKALAFYVLRQLQLDRTSDAAIAEQPLELENRAELSDIIAAGRKFPDVAFTTSQLTER
jgi:hypothetical protein